MKSSVHCITSVQTVCDTDPETEDTDQQINGAVSTPETKPKLKKINSLSSVVSPRSLMRNYSLYFGHSSSNNNLDKLDLTERQVVLLDTITKRTLLIFFQCFFTIIHAILKIVLGVTGINSNHGQVLWIVCKIGIMIAYVVNPLCIWLSFVFAKKEYNVLCKCFHRRFYRCCKLCAMYKLDTRDHELTQMYNLMQDR